MNVSSLTEMPTVAHLMPPRPLERAPAAAPGAARGGPDAGPGVDLRLSGVTQTMTYNVARSGTDVFNAERVQAMRAAIQNGSFSVNAEVIAERLLGHAREMLSVAGATRADVGPAPLR